MKHTLLLAAMALLMPLLINGQNMFSKGDKVLNLGVGFGSTLYSGSFYTSRVPPVSTSLEVGVKDELFDEDSSLGIGGYLGYTGAKWESNGWGWNYSSLILGARGLLHYQLLDDWDTYTGVMLGYNIVSSSSFGSEGSWNSYATTGSGLTSSWFIGGRYYFSENIAGMFELGYGIAYLNLGIALKL